MLLQVDALTKRYGGALALDAVSLAVEAGQVVGLVGDNGAGKSTLMKCITGAVTPDAGQIVFDGTPLTPDTHATRLAGIEMIYQDLDLCPQLDVAANIFLGREMTRGLLLDLKAMQREAQKLLETLNADIDVSRPAGQLSGGQQQAVAIARALLFSPHLLIMDEPTAALGVKEARRVLDLIPPLKARGIAIIMISHKLPEVLEVADRIVLMRHGRVAEGYK